MQAEIIPTHSYYREVIAAPDATTRLALYREKFIEPWSAMMQAVAPMMGASADDPLAGARAWHWLLPDDLTTVPQSLQKLEAADAWAVGQQALETACARFAPYADRIPFDTVTGWIVLANPATSDPVGRGYTGAMDFYAPRIIAQFDTPNDYNIPRLPGLMVHEMHHLIRGKAFPWSMTGTTVADYIVMEGLAESFAAALFGEAVVGYYVTDISTEDLARARAKLGTALETAGFNVIRAYIFGDRLARQFNLEPVGMPDYGGYAVGYHVVQAYLARTGNTIEQATFVPAMEIVTESGYFN